MNCQDFEILLADAIGDELSSADRPAFDAHLAECARCREEYDSSRRAIETMRTLPGPRRVTVRREGNRLVIEEPRTTESDGVADSGGSRSALFRFRGVYRYAASVLIAFTAGYAFHAGLLLTNVGHQTTPIVESPPVGQDLKSAVFEASNRKPARSDLAKCLVAMAGRRR